MWTVQYACMEQKRDNRYERPKDFEVGKSEQKGYTEHDDNEHKGNNNGDKSIRFKSSYTTNQVTVKEKKQNNTMNAEAALLNWNQ